MLAVVGTPAAAMAHVHTVATPHHVQQLANGQNHAPFVNNVSCGVVDPAGYGLETAHHGPDSGTPGAADGCYRRDAAPDDHSPAID
jgi:hypothetical protein